MRFLLVLASLDIASEPQIVRLLMNSYSFLIDMLSILPSSELRSHCNIFGPIRTTANQSKFTNSISRTARHHTRYSYLAKKYSS